MQAMPSKLTRLPPKQASPADSGLMTRPTPEEDEDNADTRVLIASEEAPATVRSDERAPSEPPPEEEWTKTSQNEIKITPAGEVRAVKAREVVIGRHAKCDVCLQDPGVSRRHARIVGVPGGPYMIEDLKSTNGTFVDGQRALKVKLRGGERIQIGPNVVFRFSFGDETEEALARKLYEASTRDPLTQCHSRRFLDERLEAEVAYARRHKSPLGAVMFDIDHFKAINDMLGHAAGDRVLREVGARIGKLIRTEDVFGRYGGEEFLVLVRGIKHKNVIRFAERVRHAIDELRIPFGNRIIEITVSLGVASLEECGKKPDGATLVALADARLYRAKRAGRNRTCGTGS